MKLISFFLVESRFHLRFDCKESKQSLVKSMKAVRNFRFEAQIVTKNFRYQSQKVAKKFRFEVRKLPTKLL